MSEGWVLPRSSWLWAAPQWSCSGSHTTPCHVLQSCTGWSGVVFPSLTGGSWSGPTVHLTHTRSQRLDLQKHATSVRFDLFIWWSLYLLTYSSVENGYSAIRETHQYTTFHMPVGQTQTFQKPHAAKRKEKKEDPSFISLYLHYAEHRILQLYRMEALLPLSHRWVHIHTRKTNSIIRFLEFWPYIYTVSETYILHSPSILCSEPHGGQNAAHFLSLFPHQVLLLCCGIWTHTIFY